ncbi:MAG: rolling circle replication-associated protein, partial [Candidatus Deferrimicrobiaceae bacterium]
GRGEIREFSASARGRMVRFLRECEADYRYMGTLTVAGEYSRDPEDFRAAVDAWLVAAMRQLKAAHQHDHDSIDNASIFWWIEFQTRGAPHLHIYYTHFMPWYDLAVRWASLCVAHGLCPEDQESSFTRTSTKFEKIRAGYRGMIAYARKYAIKEEQKHEVEGVLEGGWRGRFWGVRGNRRRGSCHIVVGSRTRAAGGVKALQKWLNDLTMLGVLDKIPWEEGEGAIYVLRNGLQWSETQYGAVLALKMAQIITTIE